MKEIECGKKFVHCQCEGRSREGVPCECFFAISDNGVIANDDAIDMGMIDVRYWKLFNAKYGEDSKVGEALYDAQSQCFKYEGMGTEISEKFADLLAGTEDDEYPKLSPYTSQEEFEEAMFVLNR